MTLLRGLHTNNADDAALWDFLRAAGKGYVGLVKVVNGNAAQFRQLKTEQGVAVTIARYILDGEDLQPVPKAAAERWYRKLRDRLVEAAAWIDFVEVPINEAYERAPWLGLYAEASAHFVRLAAQDGIKVLVGNFARGNTEPDVFTQFVPALRAVKECGGGLSVHEYFHRGQLDLTWQVGRIQRLYETIPPDLRVPVWVTEYGLDNGDVPGYTRLLAGWRAANYRNAAEYVADLDAGRVYYETACPFVQGVCVFNVGDGNTSPWRSFHANDPAVRAWVAAGPRVSEPAPVPVPVPVPEPPPTPRPFDANPGGYSVGAGFVAEAVRRRTQLVSDEMYLNGPRGALSMAVTGDGLLVWTQAGGVRFARFE